MNQYVIVILIILIILLIIAFINMYIYNDTYEHLTITDSSYSDCKVGCIIACRKRNGLSDPSCYSEDSDCYKDFMACYNVCTDDCVIV